MKIWNSGLSSVWLGFVHWPEVGEICKDLTGSAAALRVLKHWHFTGIVFRSVLTSGNDVGV